MRRRCWVFLLLCLFTIALFVSPLTSARATLSVDEAATRFLFQPERTGASLALINSLGHAVKAQVTVELIDPQGRVRASNVLDQTITEGASSIFLPLAFKPTDLKEKDRPQLIWYRLRYSIAPTESQESFEKVEGVVSLSEIATELFEVQVVSSAYAREAGRFRAHLRAAHPISGKPAAGVQVEARIKIEAEDNKQAQTELKASGVTDADGYASLDFLLPRQVKTDGADLEVTARLGTLVQHGEDTIHFDQMSRIFITTDKPLYQPGQLLHARALVFSPLMQAIPNAKTPFKIEDPEGTVVFRAQLETSRFGIASADWQIPDNTRLGDYTIAFGREDDSYAFYRVKISRYDLPNFTASVKPDRGYYLPGQNASVEVRADYLFGQPVKRGHVRVVRESERQWNYREQKWELKEGDKYEGDTNAEGRFTARIDLKQAHEDLNDEDWSRYTDLTYAAYFTDSSTGRTEQRRFDIRVTKEPIHIYVTGNTYDQSSRLPLEFYVSTSYADGTPAQCEVAVRQASDDIEPEDPRLRASGNYLASLRTNAYGLAKVSNLKVPDSGGRLFLRFLARDAAGKIGRSKLNFYYEDDPAIRVSTNKALYRPGEPVKIKIDSSEKELVAVLEVSREWQVVHSQQVRLHKGHAVVTLPYNDQFSDALLISAFATINAREDISDGHTIIFPRNKDLKLDVQTGKATYRPGEEAHVEFSARQPNGLAAESALGVVVFDRAVEERVRSDQEFGSSSSIYGNYGGLLGWDDAIAGVSRKDLERLDLKKPVPKALDLLAEVLLNRNGNPGPNNFDGDNYDLDQPKVFSELTSKQLKPINASLSARYLLRREYPADEAALKRILTDSGISWDELFDPWGTRYRAEFYIENEFDVLKLSSAGADKSFYTTDDFSVGNLRWPYFRTVGEAIDRAVRNFHARTGSYIRDEAALSSELRNEGVDYQSLRDRWGKPYRVVFEIRNVNYVVKVWSSGLNQKFEARSDSLRDDFPLWTSTIDYFAEIRMKIDAALNARVKARQSFPQNENELVEALSAQEIDFKALRDPWGHGYYSTMSTASRYTDRVIIESRAQFGEKPQTHTAVKPVTQTVGLVNIRSAGPDGKQGTVDDFDAALFTIVLGEQDRDSKAPVTVAPLTILSDQSGAITGTVVDPNGGVIPNIVIKASPSGTSQTYEGISTEEGKFVITNLPPGMYELHIEPTGGFMGFTMTNLLVRPGNILEVNITLEPGTTSSVVMVSGSEESTVQTLAFSVSGSRSRSNSFLLDSSGRKINVITKSSTGDQGLQTSTPRLREYFPETLLWQPSLETDSNGRAALRFKLADNITTWKLAVIGSTTNGKIGMAEKEILAFQPFFVEHDPPRILTQGDEIQLPVVLRNYLDKAQSVKLEIKPEDWFTLLGPAEKNAQVAAGDNSRQTFDFRATASIKDGKQRITATALAANDQIEKPVSVHPDGEEIANTTSGTVDESATLSTVIPANAISGTARVELKVYPNLMAHVVESIEGIMQRPYGCAEQSISAAYPGLLALRGYKHLGKESPIAAKARRYARAGYERLLNYRTSEGGFSYWGRGDADLALTAYALRFLHDAAEVTDIDPDVIREARDWLIKQQRADGSWYARVWWEDTEDKRRTAMLTAYVARVLAVTKERDSVERPAGDQSSGVTASTSLKRAMTYLSERYPEIDEPYVIAAYALAAMEGGEVDGARRAIEKLRSLAHEDAGMSYWSLEMNTPFYGWGQAGRIETTALVLQALSKYCGLPNAECGLSDSGSSNPQSEIRNPQSAQSKIRIPQLVDRGLLFLLRQQDRFGVWYSTQATINTLDTLVTLLSSPSPERNVGSPSSAGRSDQAQVFVNGKLSTTIDMPSTYELAIPITVDLSRFVSSGENRVEVRRASGATRATAQVVATYYSPWPERKLLSHAATDDTAQPLRLGVTYDKTTATVGDEIVCKVSAERVGFKGYGMLLAEIGLPPGADVDRASLERAMKDSGWGLSQYDVLPDRVVVYLWPQAGGTKFEFKFRPRFGLAAQTAASLLYDYYNPEARVVVAPRKFVVK